VVKVVYIGGFGRSGSTLLAHLLDSQPGFCAVGELKFVWERGLKRNELCSCGTPFRSCGFWDSVGDRAFGGWEALDVDEVLALRDRVVRHRFAPALASARLSPDYRVDVDRYATLTRRLVGAVAAVSGCDTIVDSSKLPLDVLVLRRIPDVDARVVHLVRDSRGVAYSWAKRVVRPEVTDGVTYMGRHSARHTAIRWVFYNGFFHALARAGVRSVVVRYEDLAVDPRREVERALQGLGLRAPGGQLAALEDGRVQVGTLHQVGGNPMRFGDGPRRVQVDDVWRTSMPRRDRLVVTSLTWPLLARYGYLSPTANGTPVRSAA
jgi:hypothetical protein